MQRQPREHDAKHLVFLRGLPCLICKDPIHTEAAHVRYSDPTVDKRKVGIAEKPDDKWAVPLCGTEHRMQHSMGEREFWEMHGINPLEIAIALYAVSGDHEAGEQIVADVRCVWR